LNTYLLGTLAEPVTKWSLGKSKKIIFPCLKEEGRQHGRCLASLAAMEPGPWVRPDFREAGFVAAGFSELVFV